MRMKVTVSLIVLLLAASFSMADGPFNRDIPDGLTSEFVQVADHLFTSYPSQPSIYPSYATITVSYWRYNLPSVGFPDGEWIRLNNQSGAPEYPERGHAYADSVETVYAGTISRPEFSFHAVYITRPKSTSVKIEWFE